MTLARLLNESPEFFAGQPQQGELRPHNDRLPRHKVAQDEIADIDAALVAMSHAFGHFTRRIQDARHGR